MKKGERGVQSSQGSDVCIKVLSCKSDMVRFKTDNTRNTYEINIKSLNNRYALAWCVNRKNWRILNSNEVTAIAVQLIEAQ